MKSFKSILQKLEQRNINRLLVSVFLTNLIVVNLLALTNNYLDYEVINKSLPFLTGISLDTLINISFGLIDVVLNVVLVYRWVNKFIIWGNSAIKLISEGENEGVEFKSSLRWDLNTNQVNKDLEYAIAKTVAGFLNSNGGTLFIGVNDHKKIIGLKADYETLNKKNGDGIMIHMTQILQSYLSKECLSYIKVRVVKINGKEIVRVDTVASKKPIYLTRDDKQEFFIRTGVVTQPMQIKEALEYIKDHWA